MPDRAGVDGAGAVVDFFGDVRPLENGAPIMGIEYEAHRPMAEQQMQAIAEEATNKFGLLGIILWHRYGFVAGGETSLFMRVSAAHRGSAFTASQWIVDELKKRVPIWKTPIFENKTQQGALSAVAITP